MSSPEQELQDAIERSYRTKVEEGYINLSAR